LDLLDFLQKKILIGDGAMGTILYANGVDRCFEELNITHPEQVYNVHKAYIEAGANVIQTNTYGANYSKLARYGLEEKVKKINAEAVKIAKRAADDKAFVIGNIGGIHGTQTLFGTDEEIKRGFREQLYCLLLEGVDGLILETYYNLDELTTVLKIAREETDIPIITNVSMHETGILENGIRLPSALEKLEQLGADVVGINCRLGPHHMIQSLREVPLPKKAFLAAYPNASLPEYRDGKLFFENKPTYFESSARDLRNQGVRLIGGCCGTTPDHIRAIAKGIEGLSPLTEKKVLPRKRLVIETSSRTKQEKPLHEIVKERTSIIVELDTPKHLDITKYLEGARKLKEAGVDAITLADNSLASPRICNASIASIIKREIGITPLVHIACRDRNLIGLQSHLMGLHTSGIHEILAITGDPSKLGDFPGATSVFDVNSFQLVQLIQHFNKGMLTSGRTLKHSTSFNIAVACNPNANRLEIEVKRLEKKIANGANYVLTQPIYCNEKIIELKEATKHLDVPIYIGIMPLTSTQNAEFLHNEVPGIKLTDEVRGRMRSASGSREQSAAESIQISKELVDTALEHFNGIYFITPFMRYELIVALVDYIHQKEEASLEKTLVY
jgi:methionine synthase / methylenetetrahydrofolate reductase(NADPH)